MELKLFQNNHIHIVIGVHNLTIESVGSDYMFLFPESYIVGYYAAIHDMFMTS